MFLKKLIFVNKVIYSEDILHYISQLNDLQFPLGVMVGATLGGQQSVKSLELHVFLHQLLVILLDL